MSVSPPKPKFAASSSGFDIPRGGTDATMRFFSCFAALRVSLWLTVTHGRPFLSFPLGVHLLDFYKYCCLKRFVLQVTSAQYFSCHCKITRRGREHLSKYAALSGWPWQKSTVTRPSLFLFLNPINPSSLLTLLHFLSPITVRDEDRAGTGFGTTLI